MLILTKKNNYRKQCVSTLLQFELLNVEGPLTLFFYDSGSQPVGRDHKVGHGGCGVSNF